MRFKASVNNPIGLHKISQALEKLGPNAIMSLSRDFVRIIRHRDCDIGIQVWMEVRPHSFFTNYRLDNPKRGEINVFFCVKDLLYITKVAQQATEIQNMNGSSVEIIKELDIELIASEKMEYIKKPVLLKAPHTYISLPSVSTLKPIAERFKSLSKYITLSANMNGTFKISLKSTACECETIFEGLENPKLDGHQPEGDSREFVQVRISSEDFLSFLNCHYLEPQCIICVITDEMQLILYVYLSIDNYQTYEAPMQPINSPQNIWTAHVPVHYE